MQKRNTTDGIFDEIRSGIKSFADTSPITSPFDLQAIMELQRKNIQALTQANQCVMQTWQSMAQRQTEMMTQIFQNNMSAKNLGNSSDVNGQPHAKPETSPANAYEKVLSNTRELVSMMQSCTVETTDILNRRALACLSEIQASSVKGVAKKTSGE